MLCWRNPILLLEVASSTIYELIIWVELEDESWRIHLALTIMTVKYERLQEASVAS
jgi:hypothetical protein